jgi:hypothetical protein
MRDFYEQLERSSSDTHAIYCEMELILEDTGCLFYNVSEDSSFVS